MKKDATADTRTAQSSQWTSPEGAVLAVVDGESAPREVKLPGEVGGVLRVGKGRDNDLVLANATVSRHHLEIVRTDEGLFARDLGSRNGTSIAGTRIHEAIVEPGTLLQLGDVTLLVRVDIEGAIVPPSASTQFGLAHGRSIAMRRLFGLLERVATSDASVLLVGETGTGKTVLARSLHAASRRARGPFEVVDCSAVSGGVIESELFGHEKGAFTGAVTAHDGAFARAEGGTVFLAEVGELPLTLQSKLVRALDSRQIRRVGGKRIIDVDVRVVATTTRDLEQEVREGRFQQDLFFRLAVVTARVPPLRDRAEDIPLIAEQVLSKLAPGASLDEDAIAQLRAHRWPGNVRELCNALERTAVLAESAGAKTLRSFAIGTARSAGEREPSHDFVDGESYRDARARAELAFERQFVAWILARHEGNIAAAARAAKMDRKYLGDLVRKHGIARS